MKLEEFKSGVYRRQYQFESFSPTPVNHDWTWEDPKINTLLEKATQALGELNAFSLIVPEVDLFIRMHIIKEAQTSSRIEGTQTEISEALKERDQIDPEKRDDWQEVQNYVQAMNDAIEQLQRLPLAVRLLRNTHETLMQGVRGEHKTPGEFRTSQNWIGGASLQDAVFIPPSHEELPDLMSDLEKFWHNEDIDVPHLVRVAISHYQFETIHPFLDGNGRVGRLLITLYLVSKGLLAQPSLYLSDHFERNKGAYYDALTRVRIANDMNHWIKFFLTAVLETSQKGKSTFQDILKLQSALDRRILDLGKRAKSGRALLTLLYRKPFMTLAEISDGLNISYQTTSRLVKQFIDMDILVETTGYQRNRLFLFDRYYKLFLG